MPITITVTRQPDVSAWADAITAGIEAWAPAAAEALREAADSCFEREVDPWGAAWAPLAQVTINERNRLGQAGKILQRSGVLRRSLAGYPVTPTSGVTRARVAPGGPSAVYAAVHQFGGEHTPARPYLPIRPGGIVELPRELHEELVAMALASIRAAIRARGGGGAEPVAAAPPLVATGT